MATSPSSPSARTPQSSPITDRATRVPSSSSANVSRPTRTSRFAPGTFTPDPGSAGTFTMLLHQARMETTLILRHGEQLLLSLIIPIMSLIGLAFFPVPGIDNPLELAVPFALALSALSAGFTGQAISVVFDRRYGALKRIGASGVPKNIIIGGKILAVLVVSVIQAVLILAIALALGWRAPLVAFPIAIVFILVGLWAFISWGLLFGGTTSSEIVLAVANLIWFLLLGAAGAAAITFGPGVPAFFTAVPSIALTDALWQATVGTFPLPHLISLIIWAVVGTLLANRFFTFTYKR